MTKILRILTLCLALSVAASIYFANPFAQQVRADNCWYGCTDGQQRSRRGCSVRFYEYAGDNNEFGIYEYTCGGSKIYCTYKYNCDDGGGGPAPVENDF